MEPEGSLPRLQQPVPIVSQFNPFNTITSHFVKNYLNIILPSTPESSKWFLPLSCPHQNPVSTSCLPIRATCPAYLITHDLITRLIFGKEYRSLSSSLCSFPHSPVTWTLLGPNILLITNFFPQCERPSFTPIPNNRQICSFCIF
jgi:hypothetical protein